MYHLHRQIMLITPDLDDTPSLHDNKGQEQQQPLYNNNSDDSNPDPEIDCGKGVILPMWRMYKDIQEPKLQNVFVKTDDSVHTSVTSKKSPNLSNATESKQNKVQSVLCRCI